MKMDEYISKEAMLKNLTSDLEHHSGEGDPLTHLIIRRFIKCIEDFPAADVQPIRHGRWIDHEKFERKNCNVCIECSVCNTWFGHDCIPKTMFCPNCGARMDLKDGEQND